MDWTRPAKCRLPRRQTTHQGKTTTDGRKRADRRRRTAARCERERGDRRSPKAARRERERADRRSPTPARHERERDDRRRRDGSQTEPGTIELILTKRGPKARALLKQKTFFLRVDLSEKAEGPFWLGEGCWGVYAVEIEFSASPALHLNAAAAPKSRKSLTIGIPHRFCYTFAPRFRPLAVSRASP